MLVIIMSIYIYLIDLANYTLHILQSSHNSALDGEA